MLLGIIVAIGVVLLLVILWVIATYNKLVTLRNRFKNAFARAGRHVGFAAIPTRLELLDDGPPDGGVRNLNVGFIMEKRQFLCFLRSQLFVPHTARSSHIFSTIRLASSSSKSSKAILAYRRRISFAKSLNPKGFSG